jgi:hypothetical protein
VPLLKPPDPQLPKSATLRARQVTRAHVCSPISCLSRLGTSGERSSTMPPESVNDQFAFLSNLMTTHAAMFETLRMNLFRFCWAVRNPPATAFSAYGQQRRGWRLLIRGTRQEKIR